MERLSLKELSQAVYAVLSDAYEVSPWTYEQIFADMERPDVDYFFQYDGKDMVGFLSLQRLFGEAELTNIALKKAYQGKGLARQLMASLEETDEPIFLEVRKSNTRAVTLYEKMGFHQVGYRKNYYQHPKEDAILMKREKR